MFTMKANQKATTQAKSALNVLSGAGVTSKSLWKALRTTAVRTSDHKLEFADGSVLRFVPESASYLAV